MVKGFRDATGRFRPTGKNKGKSKRRKSLGVEIVSVTLEPKTINKVKQRQVKNIKKGTPNPSFSQAINQLVDQA
ncbi:MAG: hypothetical protein KJI69_04400 [Patescibacteria group bacterium]|nr:hypothetical protein [Patescibacteria group bacterium]